MTDLRSQQEMHLLEHLPRLADDPLTYLTFTDFIDQLDDDVLLGNAAQTPLALSLEQTLQKVALLDQSESLEGQTRRRLGNFIIPSLLVRRDGYVIAGNDLGLDALAMRVGDHISALSYDLDQSVPLIDLIRSCSAAQRNSDAPLLKQAFHKSTGRTATIACIPAQIGAEQVSGVYLFVIDPLLRDEALALMIASYGLTEAEGHILDAFSKGQSLPDIAQSRQRSLATVRTQFQTVLEKIGVRNQPELMRLSHAVSQFVTVQESLNTDRQHPLRKRMDVLRPNGRSVDVQICGDFSGRPVVFFPGSFLFSFSAQIEQAFKAAGLCVFSIARPGFGQTDPVPAGMDRAACIADDVRAVLRQVEAPSAPFLVHSTGVPAAIQAGPALHGIVERLVVIGGLAPPAIMRRHKPKVSMTAALLQAAGRSKSLLKLLLSARHRLYLKLGSKRFLSRQYAVCPVDQQLATHDDFIPEFELAVKVLTAQGYVPGTEELMDCLGDWGDAIPQFPAPIHILHGALDPLCPQSAMHAFAAAYPAKVSVDVTEGAGHFLLHHSPGKVIAALQARIN